MGFLCSLFRSLLPQQLPFHIDTGWCAGGSSDFSVRMRALAEFVVHAKSRSEAFRGPSLRFREGLAGLAVSIGRTEAKVRDEPVQADE